MINNINNKVILYQIAQLGHPVLRKKAMAVEDIKNSEIQRLIDDLIATIVDAGGVGLAANQVYQPVKIFILASRPSQCYPDAPKMEPTAIINPRIVSASENKIKNWEACLSIPGIRGLIPRHQSIEVEYTSREGVVIKKEFNDFVARIFQHECDHLEGVVFLDRLESNKDIISEKEYQRIINQ